MGRTATDEGMYESDRNREGYIAEGSRRLLEALWEHHPRRMRLAFTYKMAVTPTPAPKPVQVFKPAVFMNNVPLLPLTGRQLIQAVADALEVSYGEIIGHGRHRAFVEARAVVVQVLRNRGWSYPRIGKLMGGRDHSTVIHAYETFDIHAERNPLVAATYNRLRQPA